MISHRADMSLSKLAVVKFEQLLRHARFMRSSLQEVPSPTTQAAAAILAGVSNEFILVASPLYRHEFSVNIC